MDDLGLSEAATSIRYHFSQPGHKLHHMKFLAKEEVKSQDSYTIFACESMWIREYQSINHGPNKQK